MSFLSWAFALGGLAIIFPILFHLIRPTPKGSQQFSSLMFLRQSPPRISKRSRIDHWLLLLMRTLVVLLLAAAFMRPFFRTGGEIFVSDMPGNRVAILIDTSASMKRADLWQNALDEVELTLDQLQSGDDVALFAFDRQLTTAAGFSSNLVVDLESRKTLIRNQLANLKPSWYNTDLGNALASVSDFVSELEESRRSETGLQIVLISDMQKGADLGGLQSSVWPEDVRVDVRMVSLPETSNATARVLSDESTVALDSENRVRLINAVDSINETFHVFWEDAAGTRDEQSKTRFYVPPGTSRVLRVPASQTLTADRLVVVGDDCTFDNQFFVTARSQQRISIAYFGNESPDDSKQPLYFLSRVIPKTKARIVTVDQYSTVEPKPWADGITPRLVVVTDAVSPDVANQLLGFVNDGGWLLAVVSDPQTLQSLQKILPTVVVKDRDRKRQGIRKDQSVRKRQGVRKGKGSEYVMFASIDFTHPLFRPLSGPRYNDFTNIRFWKHLPISIDESAEDSQVVVRFDDDSVAIWQTALGKGTVIGMSSSWRPDDSQLALSTKFVPLITSLLNMSDRSPQVSNSWLVGDSIRLPVSENRWNLERPDGQKQEISNEAGDSGIFDMPGIYAFTNGDRQFQVAVNLAPAESQTSALDSASLESFDVRIGTQPSREELAGSLRKLKDKQLENRQRIWKWLLLAAICLLVLETMLAGKRQTQSVINEAVA